MPSRIEDYAFIGDTQTGALVGRDGSIDWLCLPRFDSGACFAAVLGDERHGRWLLRPSGEVRRTRRRYLPDTLVLETEFETDEGVVRLLDCMPVRQEHPDLVRVVRGVRGRVPMRLELVIRFDYGAIVPWVRQIGGTLTAVAGPDALVLATPVEVAGEDLRTVGTFAVSEGESVPFALTWHPSARRAPAPVDAAIAVEETAAWWRRWSSRCTYRGAWRDQVVRSLITLKALTYAPTGGMVAAPTTSLPEQLGGVRNWDYRYCWLRDATFTLLALLLAGYTDEASAWRDWLLRAIAGDPRQLQIMYGVAGERRLPELELPWLPGYEGSRPVRTGNAASSQFQLDVYGEVIDLLYQARHAGIPISGPAWDMQRALLAFVERSWRAPDESLWEVRGPRRHFTHSKVMAWVAVDRAIKAVEHFRVEGPVAHWRRLRDTIHDEVCRHGYDTQRNTFVQSYESDRLDASLLMMPLVGFLPADDPRIQGTVAAIQRHLCQDGFIQRYEADERIDGLPSGEGAFLLCSFWLVDNLALAGRADEARALFERLLGLCNDVGLLSEEYDPQTRRLVGNFPQAFTHVGLINSAHNLTRTTGPAHQRGREEHGSSAGPDRAG